MAYNGWKNYETWNVALWLGNDEGLYRTAKDFADQCEGRLSGKTAQWFVYEIMPNGTPDFKDRGGAVAYRKVHWPSIAEMLRELAA